MKKKGLGAILIIILLLIFDQWLKIAVKTNMLLGQSIEITSWFKIYFTENPGMAFGMEIIGKLYLTVFRIIAMGFMIWYLARIIKQDYKFGYIACIALVTVGAIGNIVDSVFYGVIFDASPYWPSQVPSPIPIDLQSRIPLPATIFPSGGGYGTWLHGKVVDMLYFPLIETTLPDWIPIIGGNEFVFFRPIFNLADSSISVGVFLLFIFYRRTLSKSFSKAESNAA
ncbi:MAG: lipoprotein signal peptidase [Tannerellaceae bacterium]|jgi:signal peptidase II|nr:lipoprotein signal peptidase [Tannerellaceae bacterium]